jgi:ribosome maturation factor RimP
MYSTPFDFGKITPCLLPDGRAAHFLFVVTSSELSQLLELTLAGLGYELIEFERSQHGRLLRIFLDKPGGISVEDCARASDHLSRLFDAEGVDYSRLEVSSPGLDRPLKKEADFARFAGEQAQIQLKEPVDGRRKFLGTLREPSAGVLRLEVEGQLMQFELANLNRARLVPKI